ncbi:four-carbon acid sugar kinase family protein [Bradyrhizobium sp. CSA207]|uniref:four-carbon acid sugar kinase family protein n=1 Tax=Bradyrhizobium sp. CSA207 TaxID=2698826 RepID=UPI0023AE707F|nr:four-carbon acid sugar kinase family protein [Bradyrhizobium sp. CSA207]
MPARGTPLRLLADDLTGALDSAAAFGSVDEPVAVCWRGAVPARGAIALDSRTREATPDEAAAAVAAVAPKLWAAGTGLAFKKIDSLLRGHEAVELAAILDVLRPAHCIIAPAFPAQRRITRGGHQYAWSEGGFRPVPVDLAAALAVSGHPAIPVAAGDALPTGISLWDAATDADLDAILAAGSALPDVLWVGSAGLASALARAAGLLPGRPAPAPLQQPILGLIGSEHAAIRAQLARLDTLHYSLSETGRDDDTVAGHLEDQGVVFASIDISPGTSRRAAAAVIERRFAGLLSRLPRPGTLIAAGGETLRGLCEALEADRLDVVGEIMPGVPRSVMRGGRWDGVAIVSKSGAFGESDLLQQLVATSVATTAGAAT